MTNYELVLVLGEPVVEQKSWTEKIKKLLGTGGKIEKEENWGRKKLAYPIQKHEEGVYLFYLLWAMAPDLKILEAKLKLEEKILRYLIIKN